MPAAERRSPIESRFRIDWPTRCCQITITNTVTASEVRVDVPLLFVRPLLATLEHAILAHPEFYQESAARFVDDPLPLRTSGRGDPS